MRDIYDEIRINRFQPCVGYVNTSIGEFFKVITLQDGNNCIEDVCFLLSQAYTYGVIQGKREERIRRRKSV
ncbi:MULTISPECIES: hypothetical protein [Blautia]|uniref:hypothetical protein n=1 Tax=Blautia TaxID=572511 RepID=UPI000BA46B43|nr:MULTISPECIES: hypothetical protein [Blautia]